MKYLKKVSSNTAGSGTAKVSGDSIPFEITSMFVKRVMPDERGQVMPWVALMMIIFLGLSALVVDIGHAVLVKRQLQASADAAALAAAQTLPKATYHDVGLAYSGAAGSRNAYSNLDVGAPTITPLCLATVTAWGNACISVATGPNAVAVTQAATFKTFFASVLGVKTMTVSATATAARGSKPLPYNLAIILDTTPSMGWADPNCGGTQLECATHGVQQLLLGLAPSLDSVSLFTFPNVTTDTVQKNHECGKVKKDHPTVGPYTFPSETATSLSTMPFTSTDKNGKSSTAQETYQVTKFSKDYRASDKADSLNKNSDVSNAVGVGFDCPGMQTSNENTFLAGAIYAAQAALVAEQAANKGTQNVIILLSDGNATSGKKDMANDPSQSTRVATDSGTYPSWIGECGQEVEAANYASHYPGHPTTFFTIAYGSPTSSMAASGPGGGNCASDVGSGKHPNITPCQAMQQMSSGWPSDQTHFYSDYYAPGGDAGCSASGPLYEVVSLDSIFKSILVNLTGARLIPNDTP